MMFFYHCCPVRIFLSICQNIVETAYHGVFTFINILCLLIYDKLLIVNKNENIHCFEMQACKFDSKHHKETQKFCRHI